MLEGAASDEGESASPGGTTCASGTDSTSWPNSELKETLNTLKSNLGEDRSSNDTITDEPVQSESPQIKEEEDDVDGFSFWQNVAKTALETHKRKSVKRKRKRKNTVSSEKTDSAKTDKEPGSMVSDETLETIAKCAIEASNTSKVDRLIQRKMSKREENKAQKLQKAKLLRQRSTVLIAGVKTPFKEAPDGVHDVEDNEETASPYYGFQKEVQAGCVVRYFCKFCNKAFEHYKSYDLKIHVNTHHRLDKQLFVCEFCAKPFYSSGALSLHIKMHKDQKSGQIFTCDECEFKTVSQKYLRKHKRLHHRSLDTPQTYFCDQCNYTSHLQKNLTRHIWEKHKADNRQREYRCTWEGCNKTFSRAEHLKTHVCRHTGEKPFKCKYCDYAAIQQTSLMWHMKRCHPHIPYEYTFRKSLSESKKAKLERVLGSNSGSKAGFGASIDSSNEPCSSRLDSSIVSKSKDSDSSAMHDTSFDPGSLHSGDSSRLRSSFDPRSFESRESAKLETSFDHRNFESGESATLETSFDHRSFESGESAKLETPFDHRSLDSGNSVRFEAPFDPQSMMPFSSGGYPSTTYGFARLSGTPLNLEKYDKKVCQFTQD